MSEPMPNCPLCDAPPTTWRRQWNCHPGTEFARCSTPRCELRLGWMTSGLWRALAALRKPLTPDEADALVRAHADAAEDLGALRRTCSTEDRHALVRRVDAAGDALRAALTHAQRKTSG